MSNVRDAAGVDWCETEIRRRMAEGAKQIDARLAWFLLEELTHLRLQASMPARLDAAIERKRIEIEDLEFVANLKRKAGL